MLLMATEVEIKNAMFKLKKVIYIEGYGSNAKKKEKIGIVTPKFDNYRNEFNPMGLVVIGLDGEFVGVYAPEAEIKTTRIMDASERELVDKLIESAKSLHSLRLEKIKFVEAMKKKENALNTKIAKSESNIMNGLDKLKKKQGYITEADVLNYLNKQLGVEFYKDYTDYYKCDFKNLVIGITMGKNKLYSVSITKSVDLGKWMHNSGYDFLDFEYDNSMYISNLSKSRDFEKLKQRYFKPLNKTMLSKLKAKETYDAGVGDKYSIEIGQNVDIDYNVDLTKDALKKLIKDLSELLKEFK